MSYGEILSKALSNTLLGMGTVFIVLVFIAFLISLLPKLTGVIESIGKKKTAQPASSVSTPAPKPVVALQEPEEELVDDLELVAVITAAIAASEGVPADGFVVRSIKRSAQNKWKRA